MMFIVLLSWREPSHLVTADFVPDMAPTLKPSEPTWTVSPPIGCYRSRLPSPFITITHRESRYSLFYRPTEGGRPSRCWCWVRLPMLTMTMGFSDQSGRGSSSSRRRSCRRCRRRWSNYTSTWTDWWSPSATRRTVCGRAVPRSSPETFNGHRLTTVRLIYGPALSLLVCLASSQTVPSSLYNTASFPPRCHLS